MVIAMTDIDTELREAVHATQVKLTVFKARRQAWENRLVECSAPGDAKRHGQATFQLARVDKAIAAVEAELRRATAISEF
jgi:hypothetical protein